MNREVIEVDRGAGEVDVVAESRTVETVERTDGIPSEVVVTDERTASTVLVEDRKVEIVEQVSQGPQGIPGADGVPGADGAAGPQGEQGPPGATSGDLHCRYEQNVPADVWTIVHNLDKEPSVTIINSAGDEVVGGVAYPNTQTVVLTFAAAFSGVAFLN